MKYLLFIIIFTIIVLVLWFGIAAQVATVDYFVSPIINSTSVPVPSTIDTEFLKGLKTAI